MSNRPFYSYMTGRPKGQSSTFGLKPFYGDPNHCRCCGAVWPCVDCKDESQPNVEITVTGTPTYNLSCKDCCNVAGTYTFHDFSASQYCCCWRWSCTFTPYLCAEGDPHNTVYLYILYIPATSMWYATLQNETGTYCCCYGGTIFFEDACGHGPFDYFLALGTGGVWCNKETGLLRAYHFHLYGQYGCLGKTAHVTLENA